MICRKCGKPNAEDALFCEYCGSPLNIPSTQEKEHQNKHLMKTLLFFITAVVCIVLVYFEIIRQLETLSEVPQFAGSISLKTAADSGQSEELLGITVDYNNYVEVYAGDGLSVHHGWFCGDVTSKKEINDNVVYIIDNVRLADSIDEMIAEEDKVRNIAVSIPKNLHKGEMTGTLGILFITKYENEYQLAHMYRIHYFESKKCVIENTTASYYMPVSITQLAEDMLTAEPSTEKDANGYWKKHSNWHNNFEVDLKGEPFEKKARIKVHLQRYMPWLNDLDKYLVTSP